MSSFYSYFSLAESTPQRGHSMEDQDSIKYAQKCIQDCRVEQIVGDSKFLREESLQELLKVRYVNYQDLTIFVRGNILLYG